MRVLLIQPEKPRRSIGGDDIHTIEPLALEYVGAGIIEDHDVQLLDLRLDRDLDGALERFRPEIVGVTAYTVHVNVATEILRKVKAWRPSTLTVVGGHHATVAREDFIVPGVDLIVSGEGVFAFREIVERHRRGESFAGIPGVTCKEGDAVVSTPYEQVIDLNTLPLPARSLTAAHRQRYFTMWMSPMAAVVTSKGCPFRCSFCAIWKTTGGRRLTREPEQILEELLQIDEPYVFFADYESLIDVERMTRLARLIKEAGIEKRYCLYGRSDTIVEHPELLKSWQEIGLQTVIVGFEFIRDEDLAAVNKHTCAANNERAIGVLQSLGVSISAYFLIRPDFTRQDFVELREYCKRLKLKFASFFMLTPLPGTDLYDEVKDSLIRRDFEFYDFFHTLLPTTLPLDEFYEEYYRLYSGVVTMRSALAFISNFSWRQMPAAARRMKRFLRRIRRIPRDYAAPGGVWPRDDLPATDG